MKRKINWIIVTILFLLVTVAFIASVTKTPKDIGEYTEFKCDVQLLSFSTEISIKKGNNKFAQVSGNILRFITDPLTMYNPSGEKIACAGDDYHLIAQDSHSIYVDNSVAIEMVGLVNFFGESYDIYDSNGNKIAKAEFNRLNTNGELYDVNGKIIADFNSKLFFRDFTVRITNDCTLDERAVLMIFCSYYSDHAADSQ